MAERTRTPYRKRRLAVGRLLLVCLLVLVLIGGIVAGILLLAKKGVPEAQLDPLPFGADVQHTFTGTGFLYNMVRIIAGTLLEVGYGRRKASEIPHILALKDRGAAGPTAPAHGLRLVKYEFLNVS